MDSTPDFLDVFRSAGENDLGDDAERMVLPGGETLFEEGDPGDALYVLLSGSLGVYVNRSGGKVQLLTLLGPGEVVGEMGVIASMSRSATIRAIRDSELLKFSKESFNRRLKINPEAMHGISQILVHRLRRASRGVNASIEPKTVALLPATSSVDAAGVARRLAAVFEKQGSRVAVIGPESADQPSAWYGTLESEHDHVLLCGVPDNDEWVRVCARQADRIVVVADSCATPRVELPADLLRHRADHQLLDLLLIHHGATERPTGTGRWLDVLTVNRHFHIRETNGGDWKRMARIISGRGLGLVLSGGGARAYAHIGVLKALAEEGIDVDFVGGTSMGGIVAACVAMDWSPDRISEEIKESFVRSNPLSDYTLPLLGLVKGRKVERLLAATFGELSIPDLWRPYFCVSSNLTTGEEHIHGRGRVCDALRASLALPGIIPPVVCEHGVLVDGAVLNNLPIDVMRALHRGPIVAVNVARDLALLPEALLGMQDSFFKTLVRPPIVSILMRSATVTGVAQEREQVERADLVIEPPLGGIEIRDWKAFDQAVEIGYLHAMKVLETSGGVLAGSRPGPAT